MAEIRLSFAGKRFHLEREMIALIEVAFITLCVENEAEASLPHLTQDTDAWVKGWSRKITSQLPQ